MSSFNIMAGGRTQVLVDEQRLQQLQAEATRLSQELERLKASMETLSAANGPAHFIAAAMALCNELAARWRAERVGLGFLKGRYVRLLALSHTEKITRHMQLVQDIEAAMEESLDQDVEITFPPPKEATFVYRATDHLAQKHGPNAVISLPLRRNDPKHRNDERFGNVVAVLTVERKSDKPFTLQEVETLRLTADLITARMADLFQSDLWIGAKVARGTRRSLAWAVGAKHTWGKLAAIAVCVFIGFACLKSGPYRAEAPFEIQAIEKQAINMPYDGVIETVNADINDLVFDDATGQAFDDLNAASPLNLILPIDRPTSVLATLQDYSQRTNLESAKADRAKAIADLMRDSATGADRNSQDQQALDVVERQIAEVRIRDAQYKLSQATIQSPINGRVFDGEWKSRLNTTVQMGQELFEVGQGTLRAELSVPDDEITELRTGQKGVLKATSYPDRPIHFTVDNIALQATVAGTKNVFKVRVTLDPKDSAWLGPGSVGMQGLAKVDLGRARYGWLWTHRMIDWLRMKLWM